MDINSRLIDCVVWHRRLVPKKHCFEARFFWFEFDLDHLDQDISNLTYLSRNRRNLFEFRDLDHVDFGQGSIKENISFFVRQEGELRNIKNIKLWTQVRCVGYVFNPVSFYLIELSDGDFCGVAEVGNTFNELKPYFIPSSAFDINGNFEYTVQKYFYVSPFIAIDTMFTFKLRANEESKVLSVTSRDYDGNLILSAWLKMQYDQLDDLSLIARFLRVPLITFKIIFLIHWHALLLWLKGVPYYRKNEKLNLQKGKLIWKK